MRCAPCGGTGRDHTAAALESLGAVLLLRCSACNGTGEVPDPPTEHTGIHTWASDCPACPARVDTSTWEVDYVVVPVADLLVTEVDHEVVSWSATFCSEDAIPVDKVDDFTWRWTEGPVPGCAPRVGDIITVLAFGPDRFTVSAVAMDAPLPYVTVLGEDGRCRFILMRDITSIERPPPTVTVPRSVIQAALDLIQYQVGDKESLEDALARALSD